MCMLGGCVGVFAFGQSVPDAGLVAAAAVAVRGPRSPPIQPSQIP